MSGYRDYILTQMLCSYIRNELDENTTAHIRISTEEIALEDWLVYVIEIAYHIGYAKSLLQNKIGETTYKKMKKTIKYNLIKRLSEGE